MARTLVFVVVSSLAVSARAAPPMGPYSYEIGGDSEIWYPSGDAEFCEPDAPPGASCLDTTTTTDGTGAITGTGVLHEHSPGDVDGDVPFTITGQLAGSTASPKPKLSLVFNGTMILHNVLGMDVEALITGTGKFTCKNPLPHGPRFQCQGRNRLCAEAVLLHKKICLGGGGFRLDVGAAGGSWTLDANLLTDPNTGAVTGDAKATLANLTSQDYGVSKGKYNAKSDLSKLTLTPVDPLSKNKISISDGLGHGVLGRKIKFKVAGETGVFSRAP